MATEKKVNTAYTKFTIKIDHQISDTDMFRVKHLLERPAKNSRFANRFDEVKEEMFHAAHKAALIAFHAACNE